MTIFRLEHFPNVCLLCLQHPEKNALLVSVDENVPQCSFKIIDIINEFTVPIPPEQHHSTPSSVCQSCIDELNTFLAYRRRLNLIVKFVVSLAQVAEGHTSPLEDLISENREDLLAIFQGLNILEKDELDIQDLLHEFDQYYIGSWRMTGERRHCTPRKNVELSEELMGHELASTTIEIELQNREEMRPDGLAEARTFHDTLDHSSESSVNISLKAYCPDEGNVAIVETFGSSRTYVDIYSDGAEHLEAPSSNNGTACNVEDRHTKGTGEEKQHKMCTKVKFRTASTTTLQQRMKKHQRSSSEPWICKRCNLGFDSKRELNQHKRSTHRDFMCDTCGMAFESKFSLQTHRKRHGMVRQHKCEYCPMEYFTMAEKALHVRQAHLKAFEVSCPVCALPFRTKQTLNQHMKSHTDQRTHTCTICGFSFKSHTHLSRHMKGVHQGVQYTCEHCNTSYRRKDKLRLHMEKAHNIQTYFVCDTCLQSYNSAEKLEKHKAHHRNPKDLQCGVCLGAYVTHEEFDEHLCITYRENYICCKRDFKFQSYYNKHMFLVHGEQTNARVKPTDGLLMGQFRAMRRQEIRCPNCEQEFRTRNQKKNHMRSCGTDPYDEQYIDEQDVQRQIGTESELQQT